MKAPFARRLAAALVLLGCAWAGCALNSHGNAPPTQMGGGGAGGSPSASSGGAGGDNTPACGNEVVEGDEECDDGNMESGDGCDASCMEEPPFDCGSTIEVPPGESIFNGSTADVPSHAHSTSCDAGLDSGDVLYAVVPQIAGLLTATVSAARDKLIYARTECNGGVDYACNTNQDDAVISLDVNAGETYFLVVDGVDGSAGNFTLSLLLEGCGDGIVNLDEECDDDNTVDSDGCTNACAVQCLQSWTKNPLNLHCYRLFDQSLEWDEAKSGCEVIGVGFYLATVTDLDEYQFVDQLVNQNAVWIGGHDRFNEGSFDWVTGEPWNWTNDNNPPWQNNEPNNFLGEDCVEMNDIRFNDEDCGANNRHLCEQTPPGL